MRALYLSLGLPVSASTRAVVKAAVRALHPSLRKTRALRSLRRRFYREMQNEHDVAQDMARKRGH